MSGNLHVASSVLRKPWTWNCNIRAFLNPRLLDTGKIAYMTPAVSSCHDLRLPCTAWAALAVLLYGVKPP